MLSKTEERHRVNVTFVKDILPYYLTSYVFIASHLMYHLTGNLLVIIWLAYIINLPYYWRLR